jgi:hypothetical protein
MDTAQHVYRGRLLAWIRTRAWHALDMATEFDVLDQDDLRATDIAVAELGWPPPAGSLASHADRCQGACP